MCPFDTIASNIRSINAIQVASEIFFVPQGALGFNSGIIRRYIVVSVIGKEHHFPVIAGTVTCWMITTRSHILCSCYCSICKISSKMHFLRHPIKKDCTSIWSECMELNIQHGSPTSNVVYSKRKKIKTQMLPQTNFNLLRSILIYCKTGNSQTDIIFWLPS